MDQIRKSIMTVRRSLPLRAKSEIEESIRIRVEELEKKEAPSSIEKYAIAAGRKALYDLSRVKTEAEGVEVITAWTRMSLSENVDEKRLVVSQIGSALLATDFEKVV